MTRLVAGLVLVVAASMLGVAPQLVAAASTSETLSADTYRRLQDIQVLIDRKQAGPAIEALSALSQRVHGKAYEYALVMQHLAHVQMLDGQTDAALRTVTTALQRNDLPRDLALDLRYFEARLLLAERRYAEGLAGLEQWFAGTGEPHAEALYFRGLAEYELGRYTEAQRSLEQAIELAGQPNEGWNEVLLAAYVAGRAMSRAEALLRRMIDASPQDLRRWKQLAGLQMEQGHQGDALATLMLAERVHPLQEDELDAIVSLYGALGMPDKAARLLEEWLRSGRFEATSRRRQYLADLWLMARERERAKQALGPLAEDRDSGDLYQLLGKLHMEDGEWAPAAAALSRAISKGGLEDVPRTRIMLGVSCLKAGQIESAIEAFTAVAREPGMKATADYWLGLARAAAEPATASP